MNKTIFEKIIDKEIPSFIVYEDDNYIAILDINPKQKGHTLLIPKLKSKDILDETNKTKESILIVATNISKLLKNKLNASGIKMVFNCGESTGQVIFHTHLHLIPYYDKKTENVNDQSVLNTILN